MLFRARGWLGRRLRDGAVHWPAALRAGRVYERTFLREPRGENAHAGRRPALFAHPAALSRLCAARLKHFKATEPNRARERGLAPFDGRVSPPSRDDDHTHCEDERGHDEEHAERDGDC